MAYIRGKSKNETKYNLALLLGQAPVDDDIPVLAKFRIQEKN